MMSDPPCSAYVYYSSCGAFLTLHTAEDAWVSVSTLVYPNSFLPGGGQDSVQANPVHQHQTLALSLPTINLLHKPLHLTQYCQKSTVLFATAKLRLVYQSQIKRTSASLGWTVL